MVQKILLSLITIALLHPVCFAQKINYSQPEKDDVRSIDFDIVGRVNNHYLIYKHIRNSHRISVYDNSMKLLNNVNMDFLPDKLVNSDIIPYKDYFYFIYQYQKRNVVRCMAARMDGDGHTGVLRDADGFVYVKEDAGKLLVGSFEPRAKPLPMEMLPAQFEFGELPEDFDPRSAQVIQTNRRRHGPNPLGLGGVGS
jgi:hypothetical protein